MFRYCTEDGCVGVPVARGLCRAHYNQAYYRHALPEICDYPRCNEIALAQKGRCGLHLTTQSSCLYCQQKVYCKGRCRTHYERYLQDNKWLKVIERLREEIQ